MTRRRSKPQNAVGRTAPGVKPAGSGGRGQINPARVSGPPTASGPPTISGRWLLMGLAITMLAAVFCAWCALCLLFRQGNWQLLYHPAAALARTPADAGLAFDAVEFAATDAGVARLKGWWIPAGPTVSSGSASGRFTVLFLHGQDGNLSDTVDALARLHRVGVNVLAFDYRGYGQSQFARPSEAHWRQDAAWALAYLLETRHVNADTIVLDGEGLGANLALEVAAAHPSLAGVVLDAPIEAPMNAVFNDARARLVPARLLARDRYDLNEPAADLRIPLLWFERLTQPGQPSQPTTAGSAQEPAVFQKVTARKMLVRLSSSAGTDKQYQDALSRWLDELPAR